MPYIDNDRQLPLHETQRIDLVGVIYISDTLTSSTRHIIGKGIRSREIGKTNAPSNWCLSVLTNKVELFELLVNDVLKRSHAKLVYVTDKECVLSSHQDGDTDYISPCNDGHLHRMPSSLPARRVYDFNPNIQEET